MVRRRQNLETLDLWEDRERALAIHPVSRETSARLDRFVALLLKWQGVGNLIAPSSVPHLWTRHIADSLQLLAIAPNARVWLDVGSGAGFPGLVLGCAAADVAGACVHLVESNGRKAVFLREAARESGAAARVHHGRAEDLLPGWQDSVDVVTARALAPLPRLLELIAPVVKRGAKALLLKGRDVEAELTDAAKYWNIQAATVPSQTDPEGRILEIRGLRRRNERLQMRELP